MSEQRRPDTHAMKLSRSIARGTHSRSVFRSWNRKPYYESRSHPLETFHEHLSVVQSYDHGNQMQANSRACDAGGVAAPEVTLEKVLAITSGNADAAVTHLYHQPFCLLPSNHLDGAPQRRVLDRIGNQIAECVKKQFGITANGRRQRRIIFAD